MTGLRARPVGLTLIGVALLSTLALGFALKAPCMFGDRSDGRAYLHYCYTDIAPLFEARQLDQHELPYLQAGNEYPVLTGMFMWLTALPAHTEQQFSLINVAVLSLFAGVVALLLYRQVGNRALYFVAAPTLLLYAFMNWDLIPVLLTTLAVVAFRSRRDVAAGALLGLAVAAKVYPVLFLIPFVADRLREGRRRSAAHLLLGTAGSWLAVNLPIAVLSLRGWSEFFRFNSARPVAEDTLWFVGCHALPGGKCSHVALINLLSLGAFLIGAAFVWRLRIAKRPDLWRWDIGFSLIVVFLLTNKVYSPQYSLWLLPWFALILPDLKLFLAFTAADLAVFLTEFSYGGTRFGLGGVQVWVLGFAVGLRAAVLVWCVIASERRPRSEPTALAGSLSVSAPAGQA
jgi:uncharacterized membrane protein